MASEGVYHIRIDDLGGDLGHEYLPRYPEVWQQIPDVLSEVTLQSEEGVINFTID